MRNQQTCTRTGRVVLTLMVVGGISGALSLLLLLTGGAFEPVPDGAVVVDTRDLPAADCWYEVGVRDDDGAPGGSKTPHVAPHCP